MAMVLREAAPFLVGMAVPPVLLLAFRLAERGRSTFTSTLVTALLLGCCASFVAGELGGDVYEGFMAVLLDTSLVFTGSQITYRLLWKPAFILYERYVAATST